MQSHDEWRVTKSERALMEEREAFDTSFWRDVNCGYCDKGCDIPLRAAVRHATHLEANLDRIRSSVRQVIEEMRAHDADGEPCCYETRGWADTLDEAIGGEK